jgi:hypothetical protein
MENSTTILHHLECIAKAEGMRTDIPISHLAELTGLSMAALVSILSELERRDEIIIELNTQGQPGDDLVVDGTVRLMKTPPDEQAVQESGL